MPQKTTGALCAAMCLCTEQGTGHGLLYCRRNYVTRQSPPDPEMFQIPDTHLWSVCMSSLLKSWKHTSLEVDQSPMPGPPWPAGWHWAEPRFIYLQNEHKELLTSWDFGGAQRAIHVYLNISMVSSFFLWGLEFSWEYGTTWGCYPSFSVCAWK